MNNYPYISVIIPVYNGEQRLPKCLDSIKQQDYPQDKIEIIIVDDDSTDNTVAMARNQYGCLIVQNGAHDPERGKSIGIENAKGEYLLFIDDDNIMPHKSWLKKMVTA
jgi:glycosyltransferase involved in cell wall biosynthesis